MCLLVIGKYNTFISYKKTFGHLFSYLYPLQIRQQNSISEYAVSVMLLN